MARRPAPEPSPVSDRSAAVPGRRREAWALVLAMVTAVALFAVATSLGAALYRGTLILVFVLACVHSGSIVLALLRPRTAAVMAVLASCGIALIAHDFAGGPWPWAVTTMITQALVIGIVAHRAGWLPAVVTLLASVGLSGIAAVFVRPPHEQESVAANLVVFASLAGGLLVIGYVWRQWQVIRAQLSSERQISEQERSRRVIAEEKTRIARELHDVIAHSMSIINVQASSASARHSGVGAELQTEFDEIAAASRRALAEMRSVLSVLREDDSLGELAPQPTLSRIPELVEQSAMSGTQVTLHWTGSRDDGGVSELAGVAAYRIVQEALSNAIRHAHGAAIEVRCDRGADSVAILVENARPQEAPTVGYGEGAGGHGLVGMRERARSVGGNVEYGPTAEGGYLVRARLPLAHPGGEQ